MWDLRNRKLSGVGWQFDLMRFEWCGGEGSTLLAEGVII